MNPAVLDAVMLRNKEIFKWIISDRILTNFSVS